jgi:hypothetical protein
VVNYESNGTIDFEYPYGVNMSVPSILIDTYSSGTSNTTVSNYWDIQYRRTVTTASSLLNNGTAYLIGAYRNVQSLALNNATQAVEGLVVDTVRGGVGLRNHTAPLEFQYGATWTEDLLFIEPDTVCVDTNLTLDYKVTQYNDSTMSDVLLTDRGGFVNLNRTVPTYDRMSSQTNPDLYGRAYKAAWINNALTAAYLNVTDPTDASKGTKAFSYFNSELNKTFLMDASSPILQLSDFDTLELSTTFGSYIPSSFSITSNATLAANMNPFGIGTSNFSVISIYPYIQSQSKNLTTRVDTLCSGAGPDDFANITNIAVVCGLMTGVPQRQNEGSPLLFDTGSVWSQKIFSCATAVRATIKTVTFGYNGTGASLSNLAVTDIQDKVYPDESAMPLWGVENTGEAVLMQDANLIWGLVSPEYENNPNVSTVRQASLYLPGYVGLNTVITAGSFGDFENLPGSDFAPGALAAAYCISSNGADCSSATDYSGAHDLAMFVRWQNLTAAASTAALIPNLIFTDSAASTIVGTKGVFGKGNVGLQNNKAAAGASVSVPVTPVVSRVRYHVPFAVPAIIVAVLLLLVTVLALVAAFFSGASIARLRLRLQQSSAGRVYTVFLAPGSDLRMGSGEWSSRFGGHEVDLSGAEPLVEGDEKREKEAMAAGDLGPESGANGNGDVKDVKK